MTALELRKRITSRLKGLSEDRLRVACDFIEYLNEREDDAATAELLQIPGFRASLDKAERQAAQGKTVPLSKVRRDV